VAFISAYTPCVWFSKLVMLACSGKTSTHSGLSKKPCSTTPGGRKAAMESMLNSAPRAPALQPPNSSRPPGERGVLVHVVFTSSCVWFRK